MKCPECGADLMISNSKYVSEEGSTEVYNEITFVCTNNSIDFNTKQPKCSLYCGPDTNHPLKIADIVRSKVG